MDASRDVGNGLRRRLGELLVDDGLLTGQMLQRALSAQARVGGGMKLGGILVGSGVISEGVLLETLARVHRCRSVGWAELSAADPAAFRLLPDKRAFKLSAFPYSIEKRTLKVAFSDPSNLAALDEVAALTGCRILPAVTSEARLMQAHEKFYSRPLGQSFWNLLNRMNRPRPAATAPIPAGPPPPPRFTGPDPEPEAPPAEIRDGPFLSEALDTGADGPTHSAPPDPFSDGYSLVDFVADALAFGVPADHIYETRPAEAPIVRSPRPSEVEQEPHDLGTPLAERPELDTTQPSRPGDSPSAAKAG